MKPGYFGAAPLFAPWTIWQQMTQIALDSQMVIAMRTAGMMGLVKQDANESQRMVQEKADAASEAMTAALRAAARGARADQVVSAALRPYRRRTKANAKRLTGGQ
ncbi:antibiotic ABC transporter [Paracoccus sp. (in: a-proteobacteria)]|uniref:antibiotic ABC transporter n=1 Tax=Paracoccus sp. TaxID=267 RepID=UPI00289ACDC8|nr:antibiotic ABC transporter [Paracoccus sp. (in: a-proteobacteria)]